MEYFEDDILYKMQGQPWSAYIEYLGRDHPLSDEEPETRPEPTCTRLPYKDIHIYGICPEVERFYAVICEMCGATVKPQGLCNHYEIWHGVGPNDPLPSLETPDKVVNKTFSASKGGTSTKCSVGNVKLKSKKSLLASSSGKLDRPIVGSHQDTGENVESELDSGQNEASTSSTVLQPVVSLSPLGSKGTVVPVSVPHSAVVAEPVAAHRLCQPAASVSLHQKKRFKPERKCLPIKDREYDPDKHCGVWNGESSKPCTRSLTCKSHSVAMRRAVPGRSKHFDKLLADQRAAKEAAVKASRSAGHSSASAPGTQGVVQDVESNQSPPGSRVSTNLKGDIVSSPRTTTLCTPAVCNTAPVAKSAPNPLKGGKLYLKSSMMTPLPSLPDLTIDTFDQHLAPASKTPLLSTVTLARFPPGHSHSPGPPRQLISKLTPLLEDITWVRSHPKPLAVCTFSGRKVDKIGYSTRRLEAVRYGLKQALAHGTIRMPVVQEFYNPLQQHRYHATSNSVAKTSNGASSPSKVASSGIIAAKSPKTTTPTSLSPRKASPTTQPSSVSPGTAGSIKTGPPKPSSNHNISSKDTTIKNGQFHVPNILSASLKRHADTPKSNSGSSVKRAKQKLDAPSDISPAELIGNLLSRKTKRVAARPNHVPLVTVAITNGVVSSSSSHRELGESKTVLTCRSNSVMTEFEHSPKTVTTFSDTTATAVKAVTQNAPSTVQVAPQQVTYLQTGPVTFQQIPLLGPQLWKNGPGVGIELRTFYLPGRCSID